MIRIRSKPYTRNNAIYLEIYFTNRIAKYYINQNILKAYGRAVRISTCDEVCRIRGMQEDLKIDDIILKNINKMLYKMK